MKNAAILALVILLVLSIAINIRQCRKARGPKRADIKSTFISLLEKRANAEREILQNNMTRYDVASLNHQLDNLYFQLIHANDIEAFKQILNVDLHYARSMGVFGIMEIANRNYSERPDIKEEEIREHAFLELAKLTASSNASVRAMALFALGKCRRYEHKEIVAKCLDDTARVGIRWLPLCSESTTDGLSTSVGYMARFALKEMLGRQAGLEYIKQMRTKYDEYPAAGAVTAKISLYNTHIPFKKDFSVPIIIENHTDKAIQIDTSADEVIKPPSEDSGGIYRERGSRCVLTVTQDQDNNGQSDFFSTLDMKVESPNKALSSFIIEPGKTHTLEFTISPWGPTRSAIPSTAVPGPAEIRGELKILLDGEQLRVLLEPVRMNFVN
jgi:hypothetical protein